MAQHGIHTEVGVSRAEDLPTPDVDTAEVRQRPGGVKGSLVSYVPQGIFRVVERFRSVRLKWLRPVFCDLRTGRFGSRPRSHFYIGFGFDVPFKSKYTSI